MATVVTRHNRAISSAGSQGTVPTGLAPTICRAPLVRPTFLDGATKSANLGQRSVLQYLENRHTVESKCNLPQINGTRQTSATSTESSKSNQRHIGLPKFALTNAPCTSAKRKQDEPLRTSTESTLIKTAICLENVNINEGDSVDVAKDEGAATPSENSGRAEGADETDSDQVDITQDEQEDANEDINDDSLEEEILADTAIETESEDVGNSQFKQINRNNKPKSSKRNGRKSRAKSCRNRRKSSKRKSKNVKTPNNTLDDSIVEETDEGSGKPNDLDYLFDVGPTIGQAPQLRKSHPPKKTKQQFFHLQSIKQASLIYGQHLPRMTKSSSFHLDQSNNSAYVFCKAATSDSLSPWKLNTGEKLHVTRVYLSEKQSGVIRECGGHYPCAPPATPTFENNNKYEYVPCMSDIRSQRAVKARLTDIQALEQKKKQKKKEEARKCELQRQKESILEEKQRQRLEIYALNKIMTAFENQNFRQFCEMQLKVEKSE